MPPASSPPPAAAPSATPTPTPAPAATTLSASSAAELTNLLQNARGGETIRLAPGRYDAVSYRGLRFTNPVTITSANATSRAELTGLALTDVKGVKVTNLKLTDITPTTTNDFMVMGSSDIVFDKVLVSSGQVSSTYENGLMMIRSSTNVTVTRSQFAQARYAISLLDNQGVVIRANYFRDLRTDGVRGGHNVNIEIADNLFTDFLPVNGDHPDAIQFWTTNETVASSNIKVADNVIVRGKGTQMQGIFLRDETQKLPYRQVSITGNTVIGSMYHGILISNAVTPTVRNNRVAGMSDMRSWISVPSDAVLSSNSAQVFIVGGVTMSALSGNSVISASTDTGTSYAQKWLTAHPQ